MGQAELTFRAMGSECHVLVATVAPEDTGATELVALDDATATDLVALAVERAELLEQCWSRFRPDSELNRLNGAAGGGAVPVSADLLTLVDRMSAAWTASGGLFDPTVLSSMTAHGYDADFATISSRTTTMVDVAFAPAPGMAGVHVDHENSTVSLPAGVGIDPGAIGKGLGADIIAGELMAAGASGALVNLGGDLVLVGSAPEGRPWSIGVEDERTPVGDPERVLRILEFPLGTDAAGVATSTTLKRRWAQGRRHHVIDPRTGTMAVSDLVQVTVVTGHAWDAEVTATTALLMQSDEAVTWLRSRDVTAILLTADRTLMTDEETDV